MTQNGNPLILSIAGKINAHAKPVVTVLGVLALILTLLSLAGLHVGNIFLFVILLPLSTLYYFSSFDSEGANTFSRFLIKLGGLSSSILVIGILFHLTHIKGDAPIIFAGFFTILTTAILPFFLRIKQIPVSYFTPERIVRTIILLLLAGWILLPGLGII